MAAIGSVGAASIAQSLGQDRGGIKIGLGGDEPSFSDVLEKALGDVSALEHRRDDAIGSFLRGDPIEIHEVMAAAEEAGIALDMLIEIRNKLTEAYRSVVQMQQ